MKIANITWLSALGNGCSNRLGAMTLAKLVLPESWHRREWDEQSRVASDRTRAAVLFISDLLM